MQNVITDFVLEVEKKLFHAFNKFINCLFLVYRNKMSKKINNEAKLKIIGEYNTTQLSCSICTDVDTSILTIKQVSYRILKKRNQVLMHPL